MDFCTELNEDGLGMYVLTDRTLELVIRLNIHILTKNKGGVNIGE